MKRTADVRVVLIGAGGMGQKHSEAWSKIGGAELVGICDVDEPRAGELARRYGVGQVLADFRKAVRLVADVVDVCVPNNLHPPVVLAALRAGKHVICEKPLAVRPRDVQRMMAARDQAGKLLMTAHHMRFTGPAQMLKRYVEQGELGEVYYGRAWHLRRRSLPNWGVFTQRKFSGGGAGVDIGVHSLDLAMWLMDNFEPVSVSGVAGCKLARQPGIYNRWGGFDQGRMDVEDFAAGFVRFANGAALSLEASWMLNVQPAMMHRLWLFGTRGGAEYPELNIFTEQRQMQIDAKITNAPQVSGYDGEIRAFFEAVAGGKDSPVPAEQTLQVIKVLDGLYRSQQSGREVRL